MPLTTGTRLGPYEIVAAIGEGGMGEVYRARDTRLDRDVAVKVLPASFAADADRLNRFEIEAKTTGQLNHPNVVSVYDVGTRDGAPYLVTELLDGETLRERLAHGALPLRKALDFATQIARGLAAAHERGIVHRDLKPENLFVTRDGRVKILDFGLARVIAPASSSETNAATMLQATNPGTVLGTVGYMSPEQVRGKTADARSDLFAFGAILQEMISGGRAFQRDSAAETMAAILKEDPPDIAASGISIPPAVDRLIRRCLEKDPEERFQSARDLGFAIEAVSGGSASTVSGSGAVPALSAPATHASRSGRAWRLVGVATAAALVIGVAIGRLVLTPAPAVPIAAGIQLRQLKFDSGVPVHQPALAPDAGSFAFVSRAAGNDDIWLQRIGGENPVNLTKDSPDDDFAPAFSPDGKFIAFRSQRSGGGIFVMGATGESVRRITDSGFNPSWSPDGHSIAYAGENITDPSGRQTVSKLYRVDVATGAKTKLYDGDGVQPQWSPDGRFLVFWGLPKGTGRRVLYSMSCDGGTPTVLLDDGAINWSPQWSTDGQFIYYASDRSRPMSLWRLPVNPRSGKAAGDSERVTVATETHYGLSPEAHGAFAFAAVSGVTSIESYAFDPATARMGPAKTVLKTSRDIWQAVPSPDGKMLALKVNDEAEDLELIRTDGTPVTRLTNDKFRDRSPEWFSDSARLVFFSDRSGSYQIWTIRTDGSGLEALTPNATATVSEPHPSPDGNTVVVSVMNTDEPALIDLTAPLADRRAQPMPSAGPRRTFRPDAWFSDGRRILGSLFDRSPGAATGIGVFLLADRTYRRLADGQSVAVLPGDKTVLGTNAGHWVIVDLATNAVHIGDAVPAGEAGAISADGRTIYAIQRQPISNLWMLTLPSVGGSAKR